MASLALIVVMIAAIALALGGLVALAPGAWVAFAGALLAVGGTASFPEGPDPALRTLRTPSWAQILGLVAAVSFVLFAAGRMAGWMAHAMEQRAMGRIIRPRANYIGPEPAAGFATS